MSIAGGIDKALCRGMKLGCDVIQLFTKNANQWRAKPLLPDAIEAFRQARRETGVRPVAAHDSYLINLASPDEGLYKRSVEALWEELERAETLGLPYLVMHPGSHRGGGEEEGFYRIARAINLLYYQGPDIKVQILLETTAGQGATVGYRFEHFARIIEMIEEDERIGVCLDTSHVFAAGYAIETSEGYEATMKEFDRIIGLDRLKLIHLNDSKVALGTRVDRHEQIGQGYLGLEPFRLLMQDPRLADIPFILETPKGWTASGEDWDKVNLRTLRGLV
ncbi:MAG: deoxyribonuclease IV [Deltaproteobacteria bacterium]|nr:deoxyribonuclease IV [Deltaproteobacteria bacterium]